LDKRLLKVEIVKVSQQSKNNKNRKTYYKKYFQRLPEAFAHGYIICNFYSPVSIFRPFEMEIQEIEAWLNLRQSPAYAQLRQLRNFNESFNKNTYWLGYNKREIHLQIESFMEKITYLFINTSLIASMSFSGACSFVR